MKDFNFKEQMYIGTVLAIPSIMLFKGALDIYALSLLVALLIVKFDPLFKRFLRSGSFALRYILVALISGGMAGGVGFIFPKTHTFLVLLWWSGFTVYSIRLFKN